MNPTARGADPGVVALVNNRLGLRALEVVLEAGTRLVGLVVHPAGQARHRDEIIARSGLPSEAVLEAPALRSPAGLAWLRQCAANIGLSAGFGYLLRPDALAAFPGGALNLHTSLLPHGRGAHPNVWAIVERTPAGATLHHMDAEVDTGDIVDQLEVRVHAADTAATLYDRLEEAAIRVLTRSWPAVLAGSAPRRPQPPGHPTHRVTDLAGLDRIDLDQPTTARALLDQLRARTFPPFDGAWFEADGERVHVEVRLTPRPAGPEQGGPA